jgi:uncharacterized delta-60 repeat protein
VAGWLAACPSEGLSQPVTGGPGDPVAEFRLRDPWIGPQTVLSPAQPVSAIARNPGGGWLIAGKLRGRGQEGRPAGLWRLNEAGEVLAPGPDALTLSSTVTAMQVMADGRLLLGGSLRLDPSLHSPRGRNLLRLLPGGRLDPAFSWAARLYFAGTILAFAEDHAGRVFAGGDFSAVHLTNQVLPYKGLIRLNPDGSPDLTWRSPLADAPATVRRILPASRGGFWIAGDFEGPAGQRHLLRLTAEGDWDEHFDATASVTRPVHDVAESGDGALWIADGELGRILPDGTSDPAFPPRLPVLGSLGVRVLLPEGDAVWIGGRIGRVDGQARTNLALVGPRGQVAAGTPPAALTVFSEDPPAEISALAHGEGGTLVVVGNFRQLNGVGRPGVGWLARDGSVEVDRLRLGLGDRMSLSGLTPALEGSLVLSGFSLECHGWRRSGLLRLRPDGGVDRSFDSAGGLQQGSGRAVEHAVVEPDGAVIATGSLVGRSDTYTLLRLRPDGSLDPEFGPDGRAASLAGTSASLSALLRLPEGALLAAGKLAGWGLPAAEGLHRLAPDGQGDPDFRAVLPPLPPDVPVRPIGALAVEPDGRLLVGGAGRLARLAPDGRLVADLTLTDPALQQLDITRLLPRADGRLLVETVHLARRTLETRQLLADGRPDPGFLAQPFRLFGAWPDGRLLFGSKESQSPARLLRAFPDGRLDGSFSVTLSNATLRLAALMPDGSVASALWMGNRPEIIRLRGDAPALSRFRLESRDGVSVDVSGQPAAEMVVEVSADWRTWTEVARRRLPPDGHERWALPPAAWRDGPAAFFRARPVTGGGG